MGETTGIPWTDATWNPWMGCHKVSEACAHCYMYRDAGRYGWDPMQVRRSKTRFDAILDRKAFLSGTKVFTCSWSDFFIPEADEWRQEAWNVIRQRPDLTIQILTKRPERIADYLPPDWGDGWPNVWLGFTAENQERFNQRAAEAEKIPAALWFVSCEPLLGRIDTCQHQGIWWNQTTGEWVRTKKPPIQWIIAGGESGPNARPSHPDWFRSLRDQAQAAGVPFFFKQWGEWAPVHELRVNEPGIKGKQWYDFDPDTTVCRIGTHVAGNLLDGRQWMEIPHHQRRGVESMAIVPLGPQAELVQKALLAQHESLFNDLVAKANEAIIDYANRGEISGVRVPVPSNLHPAIEKMLANAFCERGWSRVEFLHEQGDGPNRPGYDYMRLSV